MEVIKLRAMVSLAETGNFSRSAEQLATTQSNVSKHILSLEKELGVSLFDRSHRQIVLTPEGRRALPRAVAILAEYDALLRESALPAPQDAPQAPVAAATPVPAPPIQPVLRVACPPIAGSALLESLFADFRRAFPEIAVESVESSDSHAENAELILCSPAQLPEGAKNVQYLGGEMLFVLLPMRHSLAYQPHLTLSQLDGQPLLLLKDNTGSYQRIVDACKVAGFKPIIRIATPRADLLPRMVADGSGISIMTETALRSVSARNVITLPLVERIGCEIALTGKDPEALSKEADCFRKFCLSHPI